MLRSIFSQITAHRLCTGAFRPLIDNTGKGRARMASIQTKAENPSLRLGSHAFVLRNKNNLGHHVLGYHISGKSSGQPVFYFHGSPSSRLEADDFNAVANEMNVCVIGVDRPGIGLSTYRPDYTLLDWPHDIRQLASHLGFSQFRVMGGSGGGPYALACAREIPEDMLKGTGILAGVAPPESSSKAISWTKWMAFAVNRWTPEWILCLFLEWALVRHSRNPDQTHWRRIIIEGMLKTMPPEDQRLLDEVSTESWIKSIRECCLTGPHGYVLDARIILRPWPFRLNSIKAKVQIWNGTEDEDTPIDSARWMTDQLPNGNLREFPGDSHFSIFHCRQNEVLKDLIEM
ncbi:alpha/beta-hydrolase [Corynespora cassiicola Philippines]|uniref:Alpha/beta-hydrolase n=1 Tax=Corynespora cassiicola Philippines TaxID=1448308 RepID=A0A2T2P813_CORCC|nr:alpha/beta-hydrolase [Corynespora cassiicola Philippines]